MDKTDIINLRQNQYEQILENYRLNLYLLEHKFKCLLKILKDKKILFDSEFENFFPVYMLDVTGIDEKGNVHGTSTITFYNSEV